MSTLWNRLKTRDARNKLKPLLCLLCTFVRQMFRVGNTWTHYKWSTRTSFIGGTNSVHLRSLPQAFIEQFFLLNHTLYNGWSFLYNFFNVQRTMYKGLETLSFIYTGRRISRCYVLKVMERSQISSQYLLNMYIYIHAPSGKIRLSSHFKDPCNASGYLKIKILELVMLS